MINNNRGLIASRTERQYISCVNYNGAGLKDDQLMPWFRAANTSVWWDMKTCPVPDKANPVQITKNIASALCEAGFRGPISNIDAFVDRHQIKRRLLGDLLRAGIRMNHCPGKRNNDGKDLLMAIMLWTMNNYPPANVLLISGNPVYANGLHILRLKKYNILLIRPDKPVVTALLQSATTIWYWASIVKGRGGVSLPAVDRKNSQIFSYHSNYFVDNHQITVEPCQLMKKPQPHPVIHVESSQPTLKAKFHQSFVEPPQPMKSQSRQACAEYPFHQASKQYTFSDEIWMDLCNILLGERRRNLFLRQRTMFDAVQFLKNSHTRIKRLSVHLIFQLLKQCIEEKHWMHISGQDWLTATVNLLNLKAYKTEQNTRHLPPLARPPDTRKLEVDLIIDSIQKFEMLGLDSDPSESDRGILLKLKSWLLQLPKSSFGHRTWFIKNCFLEDSGLCLEPQIFKYLVKEFPEDFHCNGTCVFIKEKQDSDAKAKKKHSVNK